MPDDSKATQSIRLGLMERSVLTLENYASSSIGDRFYSKEFLDEICDRRSEIYARQAKMTASLFLVTTLLAFFDTVSGSIQILGISFSISTSAASALSVIVASAYLGTVFATLDQMIIDRYINALGNRIGYFSFPLMLINRTAINLWSELMTPKYFGLKSGTRHHVMQFILLLFSILIFLVGSLYPISMCVNTAINVYANVDSYYVEYILSGVSVFLCLFALVVILAFSIKYEFFENNLSEVPDSFSAVGAEDRPQGKSDTGAN